MVRVFAHGAMGRQSILHGVDPLSYFSFQPVIHDWCNKGRGMCYPVCGMVHIKEPLLLIDKSSLCGGSGFPLSLSEWSFTICPTPYNRKIKCVECHTRTRTRVCRQLKRWRYLTGRFVLFCKCTRVIYHV